jgi:hypothetical protein
VTIRERVAVGIAPARGGGWVVADATGRVLEHRAEPVPGLLQVVGGMPAGAPASIVARPVADGLLVAAALPSGLRPKVSAIAVAPTGIELRLAPAGVVRLGSATDLATKLDAVLTVLEHANTTGMAVLDVRVPGAPVLTRG